MRHAFLLLVGLAWQFSYDLTKSTTLWRGKENAIFYINKFCFLSTELQGVQGFYASEYGVKASEDWGLSFSLRAEG